MKKVPANSVSAGHKVFSHKRAKLTLFTALLLLVLSGVAASLTIIRLYLSESWVRNTYAVEVALGDLGSILAVVGGGRLAYLDSPTDKLLRDF
jgi:signal transduction histidine kinase